MRTTQVARRAGVKEQHVQGLVDLGDDWTRVPYLESPTADVTDDFLSGRLSTIGTFARNRPPDPTGLAEALAIASVTAF